ncbi:hypothetical protein DW1_1592 [Proteiniborus sp. DW1]|uniref:hypothetical protein n=1 Tax=Proteiniborus sp. DW1 TaxID=1889883 RepID=UPI00092E0567|nr:hypothetical protein [Proteiniborus sp. DW1]SCG83162.1 hypothetical protein DW1_1592 [Proteiniborus sp. DW1]
MSETVLIFFMAFYMIYIITFQIPKKINELEDKIDNLNRQLKEVNLKLIDVINKENIR